MKVYVVMVIRDNDYENMIASAVYYHEDRAEKEVEFVEKEEGVKALILESYLI